MSFAQVEKLRSRALAKVSEIRGRMAGQNLLQGQLLQGQIINKARARIQQARTTLQRGQYGKGSLIQNIQKRTGVRVRGFRPSDVTQLMEPTRSGRGFSIAEEPAYPADHREIVIEA